jgi:hypothetical protein
MAGIRGSGRRVRHRSRTSAAVLIAATAVLATAAGLGTVALLHPWSRNVAQPSQAPLSSKVISEQPVGLANLGPPGEAGTAGSNAALLYSSAGGLVFMPSTGGESVPSGQQWQADQMRGGSLVLLFTPDGLCLTAVGTGQQASAQLEHCDSQASQRWYHPFQGTDSDGRDYWQLRSAAEGQCLSASGSPLQGLSAVAMQSCSPARPWQQLVMFWSAY